MEGKSLMLAGKRLSNLTGLVLFKGGTKAKGRAQHTQMEQKELATRGAASRGFL